MGRIRVLPDQVANKIAAGEVVERPASVVKELLENSLDAGATDLRMEVESGGRRLIRIADDGCGMLRDDALLAFERHATSKLRDVKDLLSIATLGFRGEALPSIASVSRLLLETRSAEETTGTRIEIAGGKMLRCEEAALGGGTVITVRDLFFNVPARKKFLRTEQTELAHIASLVTHYSLAHPDKTFQLTSGADGTAARDAGGDAAGARLPGVRQPGAGRPGGDRRARAATVPAAAERAAFRSHRGIPPRAGRAAQRALFRLSGFFSRPQVQKGNRNSIYIFVNGRLIRDRLLLHALSSAYHNLMPPSSYPFALLFLECDAEEVDVNVHPSKTEVRFRHGSFVHDFVRDTHPRAVDGEPAGAGVHACTATAVARCAARRAACRIRNSARCSKNEPAAASVLRTCAVAPRHAGAGGCDAELPEFTLRPAAGPAPRLDFSAPPLEVTPGPPPSGKLLAPSRCARRISAGCAFRRPKRRSPRSRICGRSGRSTRASSSPPAATGSGLSISTWRTSAFCSSR